MTTGVNIPVNIIGDAAVIAALHRIEEALRNTGTSAAASAPRVQTLGEKFSGLAVAARHVNELREFVVTLGAALSSTVRRVADLTAEQQRLDANSTRLNLNFREAAEGAGGFVSEMQTMQLATALANRGINATQSELNALARVGMARAVDAGKNVEEVFDSIADSVIEGGEELEKFGGSLHRVSDSTHSASERMEALAQRGREVAAPLRTAADEVHRLDDEFTRMRRTLASGFAMEFARLASLPTDMRNAADEGAKFNEELTKAAQTAARIVFSVGNGIGVIFGGVGTALGAMIGAVATLGSGFAEIARFQASFLRGDMRGAMAHANIPAAMRSTWTEWTGQGSTTLQLGQFMERSMARLVAQDEDSTRRPSRAPGRPAQDPNVMTFTAEETLSIQRAEQERRSRARGSGGGATRSEADLARIEAGIAMAERMSAAQREARFGTDYQEIAGIVVGAVDILGRLRRQRIENLEGQTRERRSGESGADRRRRVADLRARIDQLKTELRTAEQGSAREARTAFAQQASTARQEYEARIAPSRERLRESIEKDRETRTEEEERAYSRTPAAARAEVQKERADRREARALEERRDNLRNFTDFMEQQYGRQVNIAREGAEGVATALRAMGSAFSDNLVAWADGTKTLEEALNDMLAATLSTIAKESAQKAAFNLAEGIFALATYRYDAAGLHFAAAAAYGALAYGAGYASSAVREAAPKRDKDKDRSAGEGGRRAAPMAAGSTTSGGPTVINVAFNGPQFGTGGVVQAARELVGVINQGALQGGVQMNRLAVGAARG